MTICINLFLVRQRVTRSSGSGTFYSKSPMQCFVKGTCTFINRKDDGGEVSFTGVHGCPEHGEEVDGVGSQNDQVVPEGLQGPFHPLLWQHLCSTLLLPYFCTQETFSDNTSCKSLSSSECCPRNKRLPVSAYASAACQLLQT
jgi:hypothetical protein